MQLSTFNNNLRFYLFIRRSIFVKEILNIQKLRFCLMGFYCSVLLFKNNDEIKKIKILKQGKF